MTFRNTLRTRWTTRLAASLALWLYGSTAGAVASEENAASAVPRRVEFNRDVRPILSDNCFLCHGPDRNRRKADLRLDLRDEALKAEALVPGKPDESELVARILSTDPDELMPPPRSNKKLDARQKEILKRWVQQGPNTSNTGRTRDRLRSRPPSAKAPSTCWSGAGSPTPG